MVCLVVLLCIRVHSPDITSQSESEQPKMKQPRLWQDLGYILGQPWLNLSYILGCQLGSDSRSAQSSQRWHQRFPLAAIPFDHQRSDALCSFSHHPNLNALNPLSPARPLRLTAVISAPISLEVQLKSSSFRSQSDNKV